MDSKDYGFRAAAFLLASLSIASLLFYFFGLGRFSTIATVLLSVEMAGLLSLGVQARRTRNAARMSLLLRGLWAGALATLVYDMVRVPVVHAGIPVFKAISYFGTVLAGADRPTMLSEVLGWSYHLSNGVSFGLMYVALSPRPGLVTAVIWGLSLEAAMLLTPYAEVFGYQRNARFLAITVGAHAAYGITLWLALRGFKTEPAPFRPMHYAAGFLGVPIVLTFLAADSNRLHAAAITQPPPSELGAGLYTLWNVPEPDRVAAIWVLTRFVDREARFYFIQPFDKVRFGTPFDMPEAEIRRHGMRSATEYLIADKRVPPTAALNALARMTNLTEVSPWMLAGDAEAGRLAEFVRTSASRLCGSTLSTSCVQELLQEMDRWYDQASPR